MNSLINFGIVLLVIEVIVLFHLLGHFLVAKLVRVPVELHLGFGPALPGCRFSRGRNLVVVAVVPLGGYVRWLPSDPPPSRDQDSQAITVLPSKAAGLAKGEVPLPPYFLTRRLAVVAGGVAMNVLLTWGCYTIYLANGA